MDPMKSVYRRAISEVTSNMDYNPQSVNGDPRPQKFGNDNFAADTRAWLNRQVYEDYKTRYLPHEQELLDAITGEDMLNERLSAISVNAGNAFEASQNSADRRLDRYGVPQDYRQDRSQQLQNNLAEKSAIASANNSTRQHVHDRNMDLIARGASTRSAIPTDF